MFRVRGWASWPVMTCVCTSYYRGRGRLALTVQPPPNLRIIDVYRDDHGRLYKGARECGWTRWNYFYRGTPDFLLSFTVTVTIATLHMYPVRIKPVTATFYCTVATEPSGSSYFTIEPGPTLTLALRITRVAAL